MKNRFRGLIYLSVGFLFISVQANARWATFEDADTEQVDFDRQIEVHKDGTYQERISAKTRILKEGARGQNATQALYYNTNSSKLKVLSASSTVEGEKYSVNLKLIEDKPLASSPNGFDQNNQVLIVYPRVELGSVLEHTYETQVKKPSIPGFFSTLGIFAFGSYWKKGQFKVNSEIPLFYEVNDPDHLLDVKETRVSGNLISLEVKLKKPAYRMPVDEHHSIIDIQTFPWVTVSTEKSWKPVVEKMLVPYEEVLRQPLPRLFQGIQQKAKKGGTLQEKINIVTSELASLTNYMGDWRTVEGRYIPRSLAQIALTRLGDCKDFSASTTAILRSIGIQADMAWVFRGEYPHLLPTTLPELNLINHAIVRVKTAEGETIWVDPTNFVSFGGKVFPDIADRTAIVFNSTSGGPAKIPQIDPLEAVEKIEKTVQSADPQGISTAILSSGKVILKGATAIPFAGQDLKSSKKTTDLYVIGMVGDESRVSQWEVGKYDLTSRVVRDLEFDYRFREENSQLKTTRGSAYLLPSGAFLPKLLTQTENRVSDLFLGMPVTFERNVKVMKRQSGSSLASIPNATGSDRCRVASKWVDAYRRLDEKNDFVQLVDSLVVKNRSIPIRELRTQEFKKFQKELKDCMGELAIVYSDSGTRLVDSPADSAQPDGVKPASKM